MRVEKCIKTWKKLKKYKKLGTVCQNIMGTIKGLENLWYDMSYRRLLEPPLKILHKK